MYTLNLNLKRSQAFVSEFHRHSKPLKRHMFSIGAVANRECDYEDAFGVVTVDRCSSSYSKQPNYVEIRRLCLRPDAPKNTASFLLGKAKEACFAMGYEVIITYTKPYELGASLKASGFILQRARWFINDSHHPRGLLTWVCVRDYSPSIEDRRWMNETLRQIQEDMQNGG